MNTVRNLLFRAFLLVALISSYVYLTYGKEAPTLTHIMRDVAWNGFITQITFLPGDSLEDSLDKEMMVIQKFLQAHQTELRVGL